MATVDTVDAIKYGFSLIGYLIAVYIVGIIVIMIGVAMGGAATGGLAGQTNLGAGLLGLLIVLVGYFIVIAGSLGIGYKVIADGVSAGVDNSSLGA